MDTFDRLSPMSSAILSRLMLAAVLLFGVTAHRVNAQDDSLAVADQLGDQAAQLYRAGHFQEAIPLAERALAINEKLLGPEHPLIAGSLKDVALAYRAAGAYAKAESCLERALRIVEKLVGPNDAATAAALNNLAVAYLDSGAFVKAMPLLERALVISEQTLGPEHSETASSLNQLAFVYAATGAYAKAEPLYQRSVAINERALGPEDPATAVALNNLAELYRATGAYARAEQFQQRALAIREKVFGSEHPTTATSLNNLGLVYAETGAYAQAEPFYVRTLAIIEKALGPEHPTTASALNNLSELYRITGAYASAESVARRALAIREKALGAEHPLTTVSVNNLAEIYRSTHAYAQAELLYQRALANHERTFGPAHPTTATSLNNLGGLYAIMGEFAKAEPLLQRALTVREKALGAEHPETASTCNNLGALYKASGAYAQAEPLLQRTLAINAAVLGPTHPNTAVAVGNLADLYDARGAYAQAERLHEQAQGIYESNTLRFLLSGSETRRLGYVQLAASRVSAMAARSLTHPSPGSAALGLTSVLQYKGRVLDTMSDSIARLRRSAQAEDRTLFDRLSAVAQELSSLTYGAPATLSSAAYRERLDTLAAQQERLQAQLSSRSAVFRQTVAPVTLAEVRQALPADAVLVEWFRYRTSDSKPGAAAGSQARYVAFVVERSGEPVAIDMGDAAVLETLIARFRATLLDPMADARGASRARTTRVDLRGLATELSAKLVKPLGPHLTPGRRLLISPDGALNLIPFAALLDAQGEYLAQNYEISYLTSGRDLLRRVDVPPRSEAVVLAAPNYGRGSSKVVSVQAARSADLDRSGLVFNPLPGTAAEAQVLQSLLHLDAQRVLIGERATEAQLRALQGPRILHLATHGFFLEDADLPALAPSLMSGMRPTAALGENPLLRSGLALAGANDRNAGGGDDGILTAAEVAQLDLLGTQLVVLSACETGLGTVDAGEGVYGLRRALVLAGAQSQLVSLWKVDDAATQQLMGKYYQRLLQGEGRSAALRAVQREMLADPSRQHPYYWAAFIPIGNWAPLTVPIHQAP